MDFVRAYPCIREIVLRYGEKAGSLSELEKAELELVTDVVHGGLSSARSSMSILRKGADG
jgi:hypothetical protein